MRPEWLAEEHFPFRSRWVEVNGNRIHYLDEGSGPLLLFVHAGPGWSFVFGSIVERLREDFRCVALDFPGAGLSQAAADYSATLRDASQVLEEFVMKLDLPELTLVVNDVGGPVALGGLARNRAELINGMVVAEAFGWPVRNENPKVARMLRLVGSRPMVALNAATNFLALLTATGFGVGRHLDRRGRATFLGPYADRQVRRNGLRILGDAARAQAFLEEVDRTLRNQLAGKPVMTVFGADSPVMKEGFAGQWAQRFPGAHQVVVPGAHHFPQMDDPDLVAAEIRAWCSREVLARSAGRASSE